MAVISLHESFNIFELPRVFYGTVTVADSNRIEIETVEGNANIYGGIFHYDVWGFLTGGIVTSFSWLNFNRAGGDISGLSLPVADLISGMTSSDVTDFYASVLAGNDRLVGSGFNDVLAGFAGKDTLLGGDGSDFLKGGTWADSLLGGSGQDTLLGGNGADQLKGNSGNDRLIGGNGNDRLVGHSGDDFISGQNGADRLLGGHGNDTINGGNGDDTLSGGAGFDMFVFRGQSGRDRVTDFTPGKDLMAFVSGPDSVDDLQFSTAGKHVWIQWEDLEVLVLKIDLQVISSPEHFLF
jgi:Ca2+-binding RTX toxin-like protein